MAYSVVFVIIMLAFSLLFMYNLGGDTSGLSGLSVAFMTMVPSVFGGNVQFFMGGAPSKAVMIILVNLFYAFTVGTEGRGEG